MIDIAQEGAIATITLTDCSALTAHHVAFGFALRDAVRDAADSDSVKAIVIRASGRDFSPAVAPADLAASVRRRQQSLRPDWHAAYAAATGLWQNVCYCKKVVITAVRGQCGGAGSMLVLCSDLTVATADASFESPFGTLPEANLVLAALTMRLNRAKAWLLGDALGASEACDAGLVNLIAADAALDAEAQAMARAAARTPLDGIAMSKINVETCLDMQGVGRDFDMAGFNAVAMRRYWDDVAAGVGS